MLFVYCFSPAKCSVGCEELRGFSASNVAFLRSRHNVELQSSDAFWWCRSLSRPVCLKDTDAGFCRSSNIRRLKLRGCFLAHGTVAAWRHFSCRSGSACYFPVMFVCFLYFFLALEGHRPTLCVCARTFRSLSLIYLILSRNVHMCKCIQWKPLCSSASRVVFLHLANNTWRSPATSILQ